jgi:UDP-N-acetylglucosamine pyrophosphorylase
MTTATKLAVVIMAAGKGTRMKDPERAKVMFELDGKPMIHYVTDLAFALRAARVVAIVGYQREAVTAYIRRYHPDAETVVQAEQLGTGHAVMQAEGALKGFDGDVLVLSGDVPLLRKKTLESLIRHHRLTQAAATILTAEPEEPSGYGRIIRSGDGSVEKIVEHKDASQAELSVREINSGIYLFRKDVLFDALKHIKPHNVQNEYYLTDVFVILRRRNLVVSALKAHHPSEVQGINTVDQLDEARVVLKGR